MTYDLGVYDIKKAVRKQIPEDTRSIVLDFNMERCILCGQCINVCKEVQLVDALCFYKKDGKTHVGAHGGVPLYCEFCGDCLAVCPVGAIVSRFSKYSFKPWQLKKTATTCSYCSDGCTINLETEGQKVMRVTSPLSYLNKFGWDAGPGDGHGGLCVRGRFGFQFIQSEERLSRTLAKFDGRQVEIPWFKAMVQIGKRLAEIKAQHGGNAIAGLISGRCTNEEVYLFQKLMRSVLGSNNIDTAARYGHMNSVLAMQHALGVGRSTTSFEKMALSDVIFMIGSNMTETNPVSCLRIKKAKAEFNAKLIVADTWQTNIMALATHPLQMAVHSQAFLIQGLIKAVIQSGLASPSFMQKYPAAYEALRRSVTPLSEEEIAQKSGLAWEKIAEAALLLAKSKRGTILWGEGIVSQEGGYQNVLRLIDLALVTGLLEKEGAGIHPICEENNEQGAVDMGGVPEFLPGQIPFSSPADRARFGAAWHTELPDTVGSSLPEILERARRGEIKALYIVGENPLGTLPVSMNVREALENIDLIICQDPFLTETGEMADFVLPAVTFAEKEGTFTDMQGKPNRVSQAFDPRGEAKPDWKIFCDLSKQLGQPLLYHGTEEIAQEIARMVPGYYAEERKPLQIDQYLSETFLSEVAGRYASLSEGAPAPQEAFPYSLTLGRSLYHSGKMSTRDAGLMKIDAAATLHIGSADAEEMGLKPADTVKVKSRRGNLEVGIEIFPSIPKGSVQFPEHFNHPPVKDLLTGSVDPVTHVLTFKQEQVALEKVVKFNLAVVSVHPNPSPSASEASKPEGNPS
jgi:formate dehydrogenase alpha subunit